VAILLEGLATQQWGRKKACAEGLKQLAELGADAAAPHAARLADALLAEASGRLWDGKEAVLSALAALAKAQPAALAAAPGGAARVVDALLAAAGRKKAAFRKAALVCLEASLRAFAPADFYPSVAPPLLEACRAHVAAQLKGAHPPAAGGGAAGGAPAADGAAPMETDEEAERPPPLLETLKALAAAYAGASAATAAAHGGELAPTLATVLEAGGTGWETVAAAVAAAKTFALTHATGPEAPPRLAKLLGALVVASRDAGAGVSQVRSAALAAMSAAVGAAGAALDPAAAAAVREHLAVVLETEKSAAIKADAKILLAALPAPM
jgi:hypothetical protein